ncbi:MAG: hypothetical protein HOV81_30690, partial [Kofleriaceae bacterium]|nr:hypothetical protein [Kofleriaceae bacterium]
ASLASTMSAGNNHRGNMFDVTAVNTIVITGFDAHPMGNTTIEIYYKPGSYAGSETNSAAWTFIGSAAVAAQPFGTPTPVPVPVNVTIPAGQTYSFYVTSKDTTIGLNYSNGSNEGGVFTSDANMQFREGVGLEYPFTAGTGGLFRPRIWNGIIHYFVPAPDSTLSSRVSYTGGRSNGVMFDLVANSDVLLRDRFDLELTSGAHDVDVYFRRGSFVGHEASVDGWERVGSTSVTSLGNGVVTSIPLIDQIFMSAGETIGIYVDTGVMSPGLRTDGGGNVGDTAVSTAELTMQVGRANGGLFGTAGAPANVRGVLAYPVCTVQP